MAERKRGGLPVWAIILIVAVPLMFATCLGGFAVWGLSLVEEQIGEQLAAHPVIIEHLGEVQNVDLLELKSTLHPDEDLFFYKLTGTKDEGIVSLKSESVSADEEQITFAELEMASGAKFSVVP